MNKTQRKRVIELLTEVCQSAEELEWDSDADPCEDLLWLRKQIEPLLAELGRPFVADRGPDHGSDKKDDAEASDSHRR